MKAGDGGVRIRVRVRTRVSGLEGIAGVEVGLGEVGGEVGGVGGLGEGGSQRRTFRRASARCKEAQAGGRSRGGSAPKVKRGSKTIRSPP